MTSSSIKLNADQQRAVEHVEGACLVTAVPGSGKTSTLTARVGHLIDQGTSSRNICCVTFTNKAAKEMKERIALSDPRARGAWVSTFHQLCLRLLHNHGKDVGLSDGFSIWDTDDTDATLNKVHNEYLIAGGIKPTKDNKLTPEERQKLFWTLDMIRENGKPIDLEGEDERVKRYLKALEKGNAVDFSGMLYLAWKLLTKYPEKAKKLSNKFQYVMVDEAQDMNDVQYAIAKILVSEHGNLFMVGDYQQSIFSWRGAKPENLRRFQEDFPGAVTITLPKNYRSRSEITQTAENLIWKNPDAEDVAIVPERGSGGKVTAGAYGTDKGEAIDIVRRIKKFKNKGFEWSDIAIIYRVNMLSQAFETVLANQSIPYVVKGGMSFFSRKEIKATLAYLTLLVNPADTNAFKRAVTHPKRAVGTVLLTKINNLAEERGIPVTEAARMVKTSSKVAKAKLYEFEKLLDKHRAMLDRGEPLAAIADGLTRKSGYRGQLKAEAKAQKDTKPGLAMCTENLDTLFGGLEQYEDEGNTSLTKYLQEITLIQEGDNARRKNAVNLLTMHSAKGLEWPIVFVVGCSSSVVPSPRSLGEKRGEEERRLFYVALTRAKDYLRVSFHEWSPRKPNRQQDPSPYFADMMDRPEDKDAIQ